MEENNRLFNLIKLATEGDTKATFEIILMFENLINKEAKINGMFSQDCKDYIIDNLIKNIKNFKKIKNF